MDQSKGRQRIVIGVASSLVIVGVAILAFSAGKGMVGTPKEVNALVAADLESSEQPASEATTLEDTAGEGQSESEAIQQLTPSVSVSPVPIVVYISGAVLHPDTYMLSAEARVKDAVVAAGGLTPDADSDHINLSEHISDAQHIYVPHLGEQVATSATNVPASKAATGGVGLININTASVAELDPLPKIGAALAQRIVDWRTANGPFQSTADIQKVKGITPSIYDAIKAQITVE